MPRKRMAVAAFEQGEGPWVVATGKETAVKVSPFKDGEMVSLEVDGLVGYHHLMAGLSPITFAKGQKYRIHKTVEAGVRPSRTCVEIQINA